jgi:putative hydrolase of the HAD superfamily
MEITHLVFDLGGVIVELRGLPIQPQWIAGNEAAESTWEKWLTSDAPKAFESGLINSGEFAERIVTELSMTVSAKDYLEYFTTLPIGPYPGAIDMLNKLKSNYTTALFSNSNEIHWPLKMGRMKLDNAFHHHFASHLMGMAKPDAQAYQYVIDKLGVDANQILFFDDNQMNVDAAIEAGMHSERVQGIDELQEKLIRHEIKCFI